jgi:hypothetical protein
MEVVFPELNVVFFIPSIVTNQLHPFASISRDKNSTPHCGDMTIAIY